MSKIRFSGSLRFAALLAIYVIMLVPAQGCAQSEANTGEMARPELAAQPGAVAAQAPLPQPELQISIPDSVCNGQPFMLKVASPSLERVKLVWGENKLDLPSTPAAGGSRQVLALLPVDLNNAPGVKNLALTITDNGKEIQHTAQVRIEQKQYPRQELKVEPKFVQLSKPDLERSQAESKRIKAVLATRSQDRYWDLPFIRPVPGAVSSLFGMARVFNGEPRSAHKGLDLRGAAGSPVKACADGRVALADNLFFAGNAVYLDHGQGVFTMYCHMSEIKVKEGDFVKAGDLIGLVGATGRVTGPHLHLSAIILGTSVDPQILLDMKMPDSQPAAPSF